jgi:hypothetical protein
VDVLDLAVILGLSRESSSRSSTISLHKDTKIYQNGIYEYADPWGKEIKSTSPYIIIYYYYIIIYKKILLLLLLLLLYI